jgi:hypothetical protein
MHEKKFALNLSASLSGPIYFEWSLLRCKSCDKTYSPLKDFFELEKYQTRTSHLRISKEIDFSLTEFIRSMAMSSVFALPMSITTIQICLGTATPTVTMMVAALRDKLCFGHKYMSGKKQVKVEYAEETWANNRTSSRNFAIRTNHSLLSGHPRL